MPISETILDVVQSSEVMIADKSFRIEILKFRNQIGGDTYFQARLYELKTISAQMIWVRSEKPTPPIQQNALDAFYLTLAILENPPSP